MITYSTRREITTPLTELRCRNCAKLLAKAHGSGVIEIKCPRCSAGVTVVNMST